MRKYFLNISSYIFLFSLLLHPANSSALQSVKIGDNETRNIAVSTHELSRIFVKGDRIVGVRGIEGAYVLSKDQVQGQVFIKPAAYYQTKPFNLFLSTEQGRNYNLFITATNSSGQDIELVPTTPSKKVEAWEKEGEYLQAIIQLMTGMINEEAPTDYSVVELDGKKKVKAINYNNLFIRPLKRYLGGKLHGEVLLIQNRGKEPITLLEKQFYQDGTRAITLLNKELPSRGQTMLVRVMSVDSD